METKRSVYNFENAITDLWNTGFHAERNAYGFSVVLQDSKAKYERVCGHEHDGVYQFPLIAEHRR